MKNLSMLRLTAASLLASCAFAAEGAASGEGAPPADTKVEEKVVLKRNGIKRPDSDSVTGKLWDIADRISKELGRPAPRKQVVDTYMAEVVNANVATAQTQYARWVVYHDAQSALAESRAQEQNERRLAKEAEKEAAAKVKQEERDAKTAAAAEEKAKKEAEKAAAKEAKDKEAAEKKAAKEAEKEAKAKEKAEADAKKAAEQNKASS